MYWTILLVRNLFLLIFLTEKSVVFMYIIYIWRKNKKFHRFRYKYHQDPGIQKTLSKPLWPLWKPYVDKGIKSNMTPLNEEGYQVCMYNLFYYITIITTINLLLLQSKVKSMWPLFLSKIINLVPWCSMGLKHSISRPQDQIPSKFGLYPDPIYAILNELKYSFFFCT